jgi:nitrite reductase (NADH) large subunit
LDDAEICGCNGVTKGKVVACIAGGAAHSLDAVRGELQGVGLVRILHRARRKPAEPVAGRGLCRRAGPKTMCKCTSFGHDDVRREIVAQGMRRFPR